MIIENIFSFLLIFISLILYWGYRCKTFWHRNNIPYVDGPIFLGNFFKTMFLKQHLSVTFDYLYNHEIAKNEPFIGVNIFYKPIILLRDPDLINRIFIKDFNCFYERHTSGNPKSDPIGANNLFQVRNPKWRLLRNKLSPVFTKSKMRKMFYMVEKVGNDLNQRVKHLVNEKEKSKLDVKEISGYFTTDVISIIAFGTYANSIKDPQNSEFLKAAKKSFMHSTWSKLAFNCIFFLPEVMSLLKLKTFDPKFESFLRRLLKTVMNERQKNEGFRNDFVDVLLKIQQLEEGNPDSIFTEDVLLAQAAVFVAAGFETSSSTIAFALYEIARNKNIQERIRKEISSILVNHENVVPFEAINSEMPFLHAVVSETLRLYPILGVLDRKCVVPEGYSLEPYSSFRIPYGMAVYVPVAPIHYNSEYYPDPKIFDPNRFLEKKMHSDTFLGFGLGPRNCIGERFAWIQVKMAIISLLKSFKIELCVNTHAPLQLDESCILSVPKDGIQIKFISDELSIL
uniref:CSON013030 protein n=1 Tax=Culicoides sonorensis TaxID=179676 RepID=A0A336M6U8_CULSO